MNTAQQHYQSTFFLILLTIFLGFQAPVSAVVFLLHGSFGQSGKWYQEGGTFHQNLKETLPDTRAVIPYSWSGRASTQGIIKDSYKLAKDIAQHVGSDITLVGHSNGGNAILYALTVLGSALAQNPDDHTKLIEMFTSEIKKTFSKESTLKISELINSEEKELIQTLTIARQRNKTRTTASSSPFLIKEVFLMGTPFSPKKFSFDLSKDICPVAQYIFNLYSPRDRVQKLVGNQKLPNHDRVTNLQVMLEEEGELIEPDHSGIRHERVGSCLMKLKDLLMNDQIDPKAPILNDGMLIIRADNTPEFIATEI